MRQVAIFVDAGYLYAQGSALLAGSRQKRPQITLQVSGVLEALKKRAGEVAPEARLLRIYWYDGLPRNGRLSTEQSEIAHARDVKLRLGLVNGYGEQKGVDSLIVTDLIDLARNHAISDALILSGDEDIRVGVQVGQTYGVRVHLLGIEATGGTQSPDLMKEADTCGEVDASTMSTWMLVAPAFLPTEAARVPVEASSIPEEAGFTVICEKIVTEVVSNLSGEEVTRGVEHMSANRNLIPPEIDRPCLARVGSMIGRELDDTERRELRQKLRNELRAKAAQ